MREKELRLALVCYGGISLAVYMHGITKEVWRLARASRAAHDGMPGTSGYQRLLGSVETAGGVRLRVLADIVAGASAGGINGVFLAQAIASGQSLDPLTDLWLECADIDRLLAPDARPWGRFAKMWAQPLVWWLAGRKGGTIERTVDKGTRAEVTAKLSHLVRARWFRPPFGGEGFVHLLLDAFEAMAKAPAGPRLLPPGQPLDLFVTVTDFRGHAERLKLNSPPEVHETEHRLVLTFSDRAHDPAGLADAAELVFAARATASFPGAFPPFTVAELDGALAKRERAWPGRAGFLKRALPRRDPAMAEATVLIDGSVLANAPFRPAIEALRNRPARREIDRRFVYIDPKPGGPAIGVGKGEPGRLPGFFATVFGALSDLPRTQPIRDNLEAIEGRSARIGAMRGIVEGLRPEVEEAIDDLFGSTWFLDRPTPSRLAAWRAKAQDRAARSAGHAYATYGHLKLAGIVGEVAAMLDALSGKRGTAAREAARASVWSAVRAQGLDKVGATRGGASPALVTFFREHDLSFRVRRLRFLARRAAEPAVAAALEAFRDAVYRCLALYLDREMQDFYGPAPREAAARIVEAPDDALAALAEARNLKATDDLVDAALAEALAALPKAERRTMLLAYLGFPFYDIATLALLQGEGLDEFDPVKVDRISPDDACAIREGGAEATLKGVQFNSFGAFFSRAFRENDYLWGRLHGADRLVDIVLSTLPADVRPGAGDTAALKHDLFAAILDEEQPRLATIAPLFAELRAEIAPLAKRGHPA